MELKPVYHALPEARETLLIVPYGIETITKVSKMIELNLLIVPYGIETLFILSVLKNN